MNISKPVPSDLLEKLMDDPDLFPKEQPATAHVTFLKVVFDLQDKDALKTTILFKAEHSDGTVVQEARSCTVEKKYTPMDVMMAIASADLPPPWAWPHVEEGFV